MKISTFSIVVGTQACDADCKFCISHSTGFEQVKNKDIKWDAFARAVALARKAGTTTLLLTGKGEPTLYSSEITLYLEALRNMGNTTPFWTPEERRELHEPIFPIMELQTNAIRIGHLAAKISRKEELTESESDFRDDLAEWKRLGLTTIAISTVGVNPELNKEVYLHHRKDRYPDLGATVDFLREELGFQVRICVMMQRTMVSSPDDVKQVVDWCRQHHVEQLTIRPIRRPKKLSILQNAADRYIMEYGLNEEQERAIDLWVRKTGNHIYTFSAGEHDFNVYDIDGQNICMADCLTVSTKPDTIRTLILYPRSGEISFHWQYSSARL